MDYPIVSHIIASLIVSPFHEFVTCQRRCSERNSLSCHYIQCGRRMRNLTSISWFCCGRDVIILTFILHTAESAGDNYVIKTPFLLVGESIDIAFQCPFLGSAWDFHYLCLEIFIRKLLHTVAAGQYALDERIILALGNEVHVHQSAACR